jgi:PmbA protein
MSTAPRVLSTIVAEIAGAARAGEQVEAYASRTRDTSIKVLRGEVESLAVAEVGGVGVRVLVDGRQGYAWAGTLDADVTSTLLDEARDNAVHGTPDEHLGLPDPASFAGVPVAALDLWRDGVDVVSTADKVALVLELERMALALDPRVRAVEAARYGDAAAESAVASSLGVATSTRRTSCSCSVSTLAGEGTATRAGYGFSVGREPADLRPEIAAAMAVERTVRLLGARPTASGRMPILFDPLVAASIIGYVGSALSGDALVKGRSMFAGRHGEVVGAPHVHLVDDPTEPESHGATPHDAEGVPTRPVPLLRDGVLVGQLHDTYTGRRTGWGSTGSAVRGGFTSPPGVGPRALRLEPGPDDVDALLARAGDAIYVQSVTGLHSGANPVSGDFSVGAEGLVVRGGAFAEPVREITVASTFQRMLADLVAVGSDLTWLPGGTAGSTLLVGDMAVSGQ